MPIQSSFKFRNLPQNEFREVAYETVGHAIEVHKELLRFSNETSFGKAMKICMGDRARTEVPVSVVFENYSKTYFLDLVVDDGAVFELKKMSGINDQHRGQLVHYLMLTNTSHGKLINFGKETVEHEFVNCRQTLQHRRQFSVDLSRWHSDSDLNRFANAMIRLLRDWGTGLDTNLYEEAVGNLVSNDSERHLQNFPIKFRDHVVGNTTLPTLRPDQVFRITAMDYDSANRFEIQLQTLLAQTDIELIAWINIHGGVTTFVSIR